MRKCCVNEPTVQKKREILQNINAFKSSQKTIQDDETINIKIVYHICYNDSTFNINNDIANATKILNDDFNKRASNFNNGKNIYNYNYKIPTIKLYGYK